MIALLRLCLGGQDSPTIPEQLHSDVKTQREKGKSLVAPELIAVVLDPAVDPSAGERYGLEQFLQRQGELRQKAHTHFVHAWVRLEGRAGNKGFVEPLVQMQRESKLVCKR